MKRITFLLMVMPLLFGMKSWAQQPHQLNFKDLYAPYTFESMTQDSRLVNFNNVETFFRNNEYNDPNNAGYTLPGARLTTFVGYSNRFGAFTMNSHLGLSAQTFFGTSRYPLGSWYYELPWLREGDRWTSVPHLLPLLGVAMQYRRSNNSLSLYLGHYGEGNCHALPSVLYNEEFNFTAQPEMGVRLLYQSPRAQGDLWINWESFIYKGDNRQESFLAGLHLCSTLHSTPKVNWQVHWVENVAHRGGEIDVRDDTYKVCSYVTSMVGLSMRYDIHTQTKPVTVEHQLWSGHSLLTHQRNLPQGYGIYANTSFTYANWMALVDFWYGNSFTAPMGGPFVNAVNKWGTVNSTHNRFFHTKVLWKIFDYENYGINLQGDLWLTGNDYTNKLLRSNTAISLSVRYTPIFSRLL